MDIGYGNGTTKYGPGVVIDLTSSEVAIAIDAYLVAHEVYVEGARTIMINVKENGLLFGGKVQVDPEGSVIYDGEKISGKGV